MPRSDQLHLGLAQRVAPAQETSAPYRLLCESLRDAFVQVAMDGRIVDCNAPYCQLLGYSAAELRALSHKDLTPERWHALEDAVVAEQVLSKGCSEVYEKEYRRQDGTLVPVELRTVLECDTDGQPLSMWAIVRDISERKRTEAALRESEARYRALAEGLPAVLMRYDREGRVVYLSPQAEGITGIPVARFVGRTNREVGMPEALCQLWEAAIARVFATAAAESLEFPFPTPEGERTFLLKLVPELDADGTAVRHVLGISTDITEHKQREQALRQSGERLRLALKGSKIAIYECDLDLRYTWIENALEGFDPAQIVGKTDADLLEADEARALSDFKRRALVSPTPVEEELQGRPGGTPRWFLMRAERLAEPGGAVRGLRVLAFDISEAKRAEQALRESKERYRLLFENMSEGFALAEMIWDDQGQPADWRYLEVNQAWSQTGVSLSQTVGRTAREVNPSIEPEWIETFGYVVRTGHPVAYTRYAAGLGKWFETFAFKHSENRFAVLFHDITERKQAEEALRASEERYRSLVEGAPDIVYSFSETRGSLFCSKRVEAVLGHSTAHLQANPYLWSRSIHPEDWPRVEAAIAAFRDEVPFDLEYRIQDRQGRWHWLHDRSIQRRLSGDEVIIDGIASDITERKESAQRQRESDLRLRLALESARMGVWELDIRSKTLYWSPEIARYFGVRLTAPAEETFLSEFVHPEDAARLKTTMERAIAERSRYVAEYRLGKQDCRWILDQGEVICDESGHPLKVVGTTMDITERKRAEIELERHRRHLSELVEQRTAALQKANDQLRHTQFAMDRAGIGIAWNSTETGRFLYVNDEICRQLGYAREELLELTVSDISPAFPPQVLRRLTEDLRASGGTFELETPHRRKDHSSYSAAVTVYLRRAADAEWLIAFVQDISARKAAEAELIRARSAAEAASRAKSAFLANMSHEIRTPLNVVLGMSHFLRRDGVTPTQAECIAKIELAGEHLLEVINAILDLSKIEAGKLELQTGDFSPGTLLEEVRCLVIDAARAKGLGIGLELDERLPTRVQGDVGRLRQALLNYANNAVKFTECGGILLRAILLSADDGGLRVRFEVQDTGVGIAPEVLPRLFSPFEQGDMSTTRAHGGTGLGLAITRRLAQLMGGGAGVHSEPGRGSCFWMTVRLGHGQEGGAERERPAADPAAALRAHHEGRHVLIADDNPINLDVAKMMLESVGLVVDTARDGVEAVEKARSGDYALALMDLQMPTMDGLEATRRLRDAPGWGERPILALTANIFAEDRHACLAAGMSDFLAKPIKAPDLYAMVLRWLPPAAADGALAAAAQRSDLDTVREPETAGVVEDVRHRLAALLSESDTAALALCEQHAASLRTLLGNDFARFMHCIRTFELQSALAILQASAHQSTHAPNG